MSGPDLHSTTVGPWLESRGYAGVVARRTGGRPDGCAIYWRREVARLLESKVVELRREGVVALQKDNVGLVVVLEVGGRKLVLATAHLLFNTKREEVRLAQIAILLAEVDQMSKVPHES